MYSTTHFYKNKWVYLCKLLEVRDEVFVMFHSIMVRDAGMPGFSHADHVSFLSVASQASDSQGTIGDDIVYW